MYIAACVVRKDTGPSREALGYFMERAERIAESLQLAMFGFPGLPVKRAQFFRRLRNRPAHFCEDFQRASHDVAR